MIIKNILRTIFNLRKVIYLKLDIEVDSIDGMNPEFQ